LWPLPLGIERDNVDSIPFNFDHNRMVSFVDHNDELTQLSGTCGGDKRFGTAHLCVHADKDKPQPALALVFRGRGEHLERNDENVVVFYQCNGWMTEEMQHL